MFASANALYERSKCFIQFFLNIRINSLKGTVNAVPFRLFKIAVFVKAWVKCVEVLLVELISCKPQTLAKALIMHYLSCSEELDYVAHVRVVNQTENVIVGCTSFLLGSHILVKVSYYVSF